jgi:hypothetical protein
MVVVVLLLHDVIIRQRTPPIAVTVPVGLVFVITWFGSRS